MMNTKFQTDNVIKQIEIEENLLKPEIQEYTQRWPLWRTPDEKVWENEQIAKLVDFAKKRPIYMKKFFLDYFKLNGTFSLNITESDSTGGKILLNKHTTVLEDSNVSAFTGEYSQGVYVRDEAIL